MMTAYFVNFASNGAHRIDRIDKPCLISRSAFCHLGLGREWLRPAFIGLVFSLSAFGMAHAGILSVSDFAKIDQIKPLFQGLMGDLVMTSRRPDITSADAECIGSIVREFKEVSDELSSFEYIITIEKEMADFGDNSPMRGIVKFAVEKSNTILTNERKRLVLMSDQCGRSPLSSRKAQQAIEVIDTTTTILASLHDRL